MVGRTEIGMFEASAGRFVAVASTWEMTDAGSLVAGIAVGRGPRLALTEA